MTSASKHKTSLTLDTSALEAARKLGINVSAVAEPAFIKAVSRARRERWLAENADAFVAQSDCYDRVGHPLAHIMAGPSRSSWTR